MNEIKLQNQSINETEFEAVQIIDSINFSKNNTTKKFTENFYKIKIKIMLCEILKFLPSIVATVIYLITLQGCAESELECLRKFSLDMMQLVVSCILLSGFLYSIQFYLCFLKKISNNHGIIAGLLIFFLCFIYDTGSNIQSHGAYNRICLLLALILCIFIKILFHCIFCYSIKRTCIILFGFGFIFITIYTSFMKILENSCKDWSRGLKSSQIDNTESGCKLTPPKYCYFEVFNGYFDVSKIVKESCYDSSSKQFAVIEPYLKENVKKAKIIGYPRTESWKFFPDSSRINFQNNVMAEIINFEDPTIASDIKNNIEAIVDFSNKYPKMTIRMNKNIELAKKRDEIFDKFKDQVITKNVLYIFVDSLSRVNLRRKLPKFYKWIEDKYEIETNSPNQLETFQFLKYHGVGPFTSLNMGPSLFGSWITDGFAEKYYISYYKERGYITGQSITVCSRELFDIEPGNLENFPWDNYDHELIAPMCDSNFTPYQNQYCIIQGANSILKRCLYGRSLVEYSLDYLKLFFDNYKDQAKFFRLALDEGHEGTGEVIRYSDDVLFNFFKDFEKMGYLHDTTVFIQSDHGLAMLGPYSVFRVEDYRKELTLPLYFILMPKNVKNYDTIKKNLKYNENSIVTSFNAYNNFLAILNDKENIKYSKMDGENDVFNKRIPRSLGCNAFYDQEYFRAYYFFCSCD